MRTHIIPMSVDARTGGGSAERVVRISDRAPVGTGKEVLGRRSILVLPRLPGRRRAILALRLPRLSRLPGLSRLTELTELRGAALQHLREQTKHLLHKTEERAEDPAHIGRAGERTAE